MTAARAHRITAGAVADPSTPHSFTLTIATCLDVAAIEAWAVDAAAGACLTYAEGWVAPRSAPGFVFARGLYDAGLVELRQGKRVQGITEWWLVRTAARWASPHTRPVNSADDRLTAAEEVLLRLCREAARKRVPLGSNATLAKASGLRNPVWASNAIKKLIRLKRIEVDYSGGNEARRVKIL